MIATPAAGKVRERRSKACIPYTGFGLALLTYWLTSGRLRLRSGGVISVEIEHRFGGGLNGGQASQIRVNDMTSAQSPDLDRPGLTGLASRLMLLLALAAFVALVALGPYGGETPSERGEPQGQREISIGESEDLEQAVFDGRGKWGGYAR